MLHCLVIRPAGASPGSQHTQRQDIRCQPGAANAQSQQTSSYCGTAQNSSNKPAAETQTAQEKVWHVLPEGWHQVKSQSLGGSNQRPLNLRCHLPPHRMARPGISLTPGRKEKWPSSYGILHCDFYQNAWKYSCLQSTHEHVTTGTCFCTAFFKGKVKKHHSGSIEKTFQQAQPAFSTTTSYVKMQRTVQTFCLHAPIWIFPFTF